MGIAFPESGDFSRFFDAFLTYPREFGFRWHHGRLFDADYKANGIVVIRRDTGGGPSGSGPLYAGLRYSDFGLLRG